MKQFIWMLCGIFVSGLLLGTLSACGADQFSTCVITTEKASPAQEAAPAPADQPEDQPAPEDAPKPGVSITAEEDEARMLAYGKALWDMYLLGLRPDGEELRLVLSEFPALTFYENGTVTADWSHNQGRAGRFWPYTLYQYSPDSGVYEETGSVDAWDLECAGGDERLAAAFPGEADADGDGLVYYILTGEWYRNDRTPSGGLDGRLWDTDPVDGADLEDWLNAYTGGAEPLKIPYRHLEEVSISDLGCPRPEVTYPEPVG